MGVHNGMLLGEAKRLCPNIATLPYDFEAYKRVSEILYRTIADFVLDIEAVSCDELYADCTDLLSISSVESPTNSQDRGYRFVNPLMFGIHVREKVHKLTGGCTASVGFGTSRLLARLATKRAKPNGQHFFVGCSHGQEVSSSLEATNSLRWRWFETSSSTSRAGDDVPSSCELNGDDGLWFSNLPLASLPGLGPAFLSRLTDAFSVETCGQLMQQDVTTSRQTERYAKSVSASMNYGIRLKTNAEMQELVGAITLELATRMTETTTDSQSSGVVGSSLTVRVFVRAPNAPVESRKYMGHGVCSTSSRNVNFPTPTGEANVLLQYALPLVRKLCPDPSQLRGLGLQIKKLLPVEKHSLRTCELKYLVNKPQQQQKPRCRKDDQSPPAERDIASRITNQTEQHGMNRKTCAEHEKLQDPTPPILLSSTGSVTEDFTGEGQAEDDLSDVFKDKSHDELKEILADWITAEPDPQSEDLNILADYLLSTVPFDLERVRFILMSFRQLIRTLATNFATWDEALSELSSRVNEAVGAWYSGSRLHFKL